MNFVAVCSQGRADRAHKLSFGHGEQQFISRSNPAQAPAPARWFAVHFIAIKRRPRIDFKVLVTWASHPWLQSTCIGRHRNALAYSPCLAFGFFFRHVEASFDPTITELEQGGAVEAWPAQPIDGAVTTNKGSRRAIADRSMHSPRWPAA